MPKYKSEPTAYAVSNMETSSKLNHSMDVLFLSFWFSVSLIQTNYACSNIISFGLIMIGEGVL